MSMEFNLIYLFTLMAHHYKLVLNPIFGQSTNKLNSRSAKFLLVSKSKSAY